MVAKSPKSVGDKLSYYKNRGRVFRGWIVSGPVDVVTIKLISGSRTNYLRNRFVETIVPGFFHIKKDILSNFLKYNEKSSGL